jgi:hypothetical protein
LGKASVTEDVAAVVAFLASELIDGGQTMRRWISAPDLDTP